MKIDGTEIIWLGHAGFCISSVGKTIYIDPFQIDENLSRADLVLITHSHYDHCSIEDLKKVCDTSTVIIAPADCQSKFQGKIDFKDCIIANIGDVKNFAGVEIRPTPAYNIRKPFHPKDNDWVGYVVSINGVRIYHSGDTDNIPEMSELKDIDVALMAVSGTYVMTAEDAARAVDSFRPKMAVPMHYGSIVGEIDDAKKFKAISQVPVSILEKNM